MTPHSNRIWTKKCDHKNDDHKEFIMPITVMTKRRWNTSRVSTALLSTSTFDFSCRRTYSQLRVITHALKPSPERREKLPTFARQNSNWRQLAAGAHTFSSIVRSDEFYDLCIWGRCTTSDSPRCQAWTSLVWRTPVTSRREVWSDRAGRPSPKDHWQLNKKGGGGEEKRHSQIR